MINTPDRILDVALKAGKILLESGAEIYRVEETICRICTNFEMEETSSIVMPTAIFVSFLYLGKSYSRVARVQTRSTDLNRIDCINSLSRNTTSHQMSLEQFAQELNTIENMGSYSLLINIIMGALVAGSFTLFFKGSFMDALCAFFIGGLVRFLIIKFDQLKVNGFFSVCICSALIAFTSLLFVHFNLAQSKDTMIIGTIMLLVPGLAITNAIRDGIAGDLISAISRGVEAILTAIAVALGPGIVISLWFLILGGL